MNNYDYSYIEEYVRHYTKNGYLHRLDGPALIYLDGSGYREWWYEGRQITNESQEEFERLLRLKAFW